jgi:hypothetical protein
MEANIDIAAYDYAWTNVPQAERDALVTRSNDLVAQHNWPEPPVGLTLFRMMKIFHGEYMVVVWRRLVF